MLSDEQLQKLAGTDATVTPLRAAPPVVEEDPEAVTRKADEEAIKGAKELPFEVGAIKAYARSQFERRLPVFIENTERQLRMLAGYGVLRANINTGCTDGKYDDYHRGTVNHLKEHGFEVHETPTGFDVLLS